MSPATRRARFCSSSLWCGSGSESALAAGLIVTLIAGTTAVATLTVARRLGSESVARAAAPFLAAGPAAIWMCVTADAMFAAWAAALLALAATARRWWVQAVMGIAAGILFGWCLMLSHGLPLLVVLGGRHPAHRTQVAAAPLGSGRRARGGRRLRRGGLRLVRGGACPARPVLGGNRQRSTRVLLNVGRPRGRRHLCRSRWRSSCNNFLYALADGHTAVSEAEDR